MTNARRSLFAVTLFAAVAAPSGGQAQTGGSRVFGDLLKRIPDQSNLLMLVNGDGIFNSAMGKREGWREKALANHQGGLGLAADASKAAVAVGLNFNSMQERWKVGIVQLRRDVPLKLDDIAAREGGYVDRVENTPVVWTPRDLYFFDFPDNLVGFASPAERKSLDHWFQSALWHPRKFAPGWADLAVFRADAGAQIVLALDLANATSGPMIEPWLNTFDSLKKAGLDPHLVAPRLASAKSAFLAIKVDQGIEGTLRIDFERDIDYVGPVARELILDVLNEFGAQLPEMKTWQLNFDKKTAVELNGRLSEDSVRKVLSMAHVPRLSGVGAPSNATAAGANAKTATSQPAPYAKAQADPVSTSQAYFRSVTTMIESLKKLDRPTYKSMKLWYDRYAKQVEELPILGVDKDLLDWGSTVARTMREMSSGVNYYSQNQKYTVASTPNGNYGGYGNYGGNSKAYDAAAVKKQTEALMSVDLDKRWQAVETSVADLRRKMVEKYKVDF